MDLYFLTWTCPNCGVSYQGTLLILLGMPPGHPCPAHRPANAFPDYGLPPGHP